MTAPKPGRGDYKPYSIPTRNPYVEETHPALNPYQFTLDDPEADPGVEDSGMGFKNNLPARGTAGENRKTVYGHAYEGGKPNNSAFGKLGPGKKL